MHKHVGAMAHWIKISRKNVQNKILNKTLRSLKESCTVYDHFVADEEDIEHRPPEMDVSTALSTSLEAPLRSREMIRPINEASQGKVLGPSLGRPNSSSTILKSSAVA